MITIKDTEGCDFNLLTTRNTSGDRYASKSNTKSGILAAIRGDSNGYDLKVTRNGDRTDFYFVGVYFVRGKLRLGCHAFHRKASAAILRWAGVTPTLQAAARKVRRSR